MLKIFPYHLKSEGARSLARALGVKRIKPGGRYTPTNRHIILNWGSTKPHFNSQRFINLPESVAIAVDKLATLQRLSSRDVRVPDFTTDRCVAESWLEDGYKVVCRHNLRGFGGQGIEVVKPGEALPMAPLYTRYIRKDNEYRVHVFNGRVIDYTEKRRSSETEPHPYVRNHENGWVFCREGVVLPEEVRLSAIKAMQALELDLGALDIVYRRGLAYVLEVNTAPGIEGTTLQRYVEALRPYV